MRSSEAPFSLIMQKSERLPHATIEERENLIPSQYPSQSGFTPRPIQKLTSKHLPKSSLSIECEGFLRSTQNSFSTFPPPNTVGQTDTLKGREDVTLMNRLWGEASKYDPPKPDRPSDTFNSSVWRNFKLLYGVDAETRQQQNVSEMIASLYPLNIPPPSSIGDYPYSKFIQDTSVIRDAKYRTQALNQVRKDQEEMLGMRLKSEMRNPPLAKQSGKILPPTNFKKYAPKFIRPDSLMTSRVPETSGPPEETRIDMFGKVVPTIANKPKPFMWKLAYKLNNPQYEQVQKEIAKRKQLQKQTRAQVIGTFIN